MRGTHNYVRISLRKRKQHLSCYSVFPSYIGQEVEYSDDHDFNTVAWHPEVDKVQELKNAWFSKNPQIRQISGSKGDKVGCVNMQDRMTRAASAR